MERRPRAVDTAARGVGIQVWKMLEMWLRKGVVGSQWSGSAWVVKVEDMCLAANPKVIMT